MEVYKEKGQSMTGTALILISLFSACRAKSTPANTDMSEFIISHPEVSSFLYGERKIRIWESSSKATSKQSQWEFRYDPIFSPVVKENGQIDMTTEKFMEDDWRTSFFVNLDDETARELAFTRLQNKFDKTEELDPENVFALPVSYLTITMPDIIASYPNVTLIGRKTSLENMVGYHFQSPVSSFRIVLSSPSREIAEDIERLIPMSMIFFNMSTVARVRRSITNKATVSYEHFKASPLYEILKFKGGVAYLSRNDLRKLLQDSRRNMLFNVVVEDEAKFNYHFYNEFTKNFGQISTNSFDENNWEQTYKSESLRPEAVSIELSKLFTFDAGSNTYKKNPGYKNMGGLDISEDVKENVDWSGEGLKDMLGRKGINAEVNGGSVVAKSADLVKIDLSDFDNSKSFVSVITYLSEPVQVAPILGYVDLHRPRHGSTEFSVQLQGMLKKLDTKFTETSSLWYNQHQNLFETVKRSIEYQSKLSAEQLTSVIGELQKKNQETAAESQTQLQSLSQISVQLQDKLDKLETKFTETNSLWYNQHQNLSETVKRSIDDHSKLSAEQVMSVNSELQKNLRETAAESNKQLQSLSQYINVKHGELAEQLTNVSLIVTKLNECTYPWKKNCFENGCHCYQFVHKRADWNTANAYCQSLDKNAALVSIHNKPETDFVFRLMKEAGYPSDHLWIGLTDQAVEGDFKWTDGTPLDYRIWYSGHPRGGQNTYDCGKFLVSTVENFLDDICSQNLYFVCKKIPNSS